MDGVRARQVFTPGCWVLEMSGGLGGGGRDTEVWLCHTCPLSSVSLEWTACIKVGSASVTFPFSTACSLWPLAQPVRCLLIDVGWMGSGGHVNLYHLVLPKPRSLTQMKFAPKPYPVEHES